MPDWWLLFTKFWQQGPMVGSVVPSSRWLARGMLRGINFQTATCIVELGAGTGPITAELLPRMAPRCRAVIVERDADLCARLRDRFPQADVVEADALDLDRVLADRQIDSVDHVLCGLSLPWFQPDEQHTILDTSRRFLTQDGSFRQLTFMPLAHSSLYRRYFHDVRSRFVLRNVPPAGIYVCDHPKREPHAIANGSPAK